jgi:hypothetical protein
MTTSRWMRRSTSKARCRGDVDRALDGVLDGHEAQVDLAGLGGGEHLGDRGEGHQLRPARSGWVSRACSVKVPGGSEEPDAQARWGGVVRRRSRPSRIVAWTRPPSGSCSTTCAPARSRPTTRWPACAACPSPTWASPGSTTTAAAPGHGRGRVRPGQDARAVRGHRGRAAGRARRRPGGAHPGRRRPGGRRPGRQPRRPRSPGTTVVWRPAPRGRAGGAAHRRHRRPARWPTSAPPCSAPTASRPRRITDVGVAGLHRLLGRRRRARRPPTPWWWWPGWRARSPAWSAASPRPGGGRAHQRRATGRASRGHRPARDARLVRVGHHRGGHRQRLRRRLRGAGLLPAGGERSVTDA